ncbi:TonB-dependent receptor [Aestuariibacter sp. A3R04]|uniref:TonB-dependent receptor n=1 Tax=Aestuariibacter sp. A3R04 TaxID=2841571 RepID=UPI001C092716|nr:TonB-dependent receptor [Aestuariibacter sp. A3R04]
MSIQKPQLSPITLALIAATLSSPVYSQEEEKNENTLEVIEITARKKLESIREIPIAISAFSAEEIARSGMSDVQDLALATPGFSYREGYGRTTGGASKRPSIRGMSSILGEANASFYVDGVFVDGPIGSFNLENLQRIEVMKGPQSASFGRGAFGGAINFITRRPDGDTRGNVTVELGQYDLAKVHGFLSGALVDDVLAGEVYFSTYSQGGMYDNAFNGKRELGEEDTDQIGFRLNYTPNDDLSVYFDYSHTKDEDGQIAYGLWNGGDNDDPTTYLPITEKSNCYTPTEIFVPPYSFFAKPMSTRSRGYWCGEIEALDAYYADNDGAPGNERTTDRMSLIVDYDFGDWSFNSTTGYTTFDYRNGFGSFGDGTTGSFSGRDGQKSLSQELRMVSNFDAPLNYLFGLYYFKSENGTLHSNSWSLADEDYDASRAVVSEDNSSVKNQAVFGMVEWDVSDKLNVSLEGRYQKEDITLDIENYRRSDSESFTAFLPRVAFTYKFNETTNMYGSVAKGNKPGGFNSAYYDPDYSADQLTEALQNGRFAYEESEVMAYEIGFKSLFLDGRLSLDTALYFLDWDKQILTTTETMVIVAPNPETGVEEPTGGYYPESILINAGESSIKGVEISGNYQMTDDLRVRFGYAYSDAQFDDYIDENVQDLLDTNGLINDAADPDGQVAGNMIPQTPKHMVNLGISYNTEVTDNWYGFARVDYNYESKRYVQSANLAYVSGSSEVNLRMGLENENWRITAWVQNAFDNDTPEAVTRLLDFREFIFIPDETRASGWRGTFARDFAVTAPRPRQVGVTVSYNF